MQLKEFYARVLPSTGTYALAYRLAEPIEYEPGKFKRWRHKYTQSIEQLADMTSRVSHMDGWYYATAGFSERVRKQAAVSAKRCLYLDIDAGPEKFAKHGDKVYPDIRAALTALSEFSKFIDAKPSLIVSTGTGGLHVYWCFDRDVAPSTWFGMATMLRRLTVLAKLRADHSCTTDSARVLRPIGATRANGQTITVVKDTGAVYSFDALTAKLMAKLPVEDTLQAAPGHNTDVNDEFFESYVGPPVSVEKVIESCAAMREATADNGAGVSEPMWRAMIGLVKHCVDGEAKAHEFSRGHDEYDEGATQEKFERWEVGPSTCAEFEKHTDACASCPHRGKVKSPISLGRMTPTQIEAAGLEPPKPPAPKPVTADAGIPAEAIEQINDDLYAVEPRGEHLMLTCAVERERDDGSTFQVRVPVCRVPFWVSGWTDAGSYDSQTGTISLKRWMHGRVREFSLPSTVLAKTDTLIAAMDGQMVPPVSHNQETKRLMHSYIDRQIARVMAAMSRPIIARHFGFQQDRETGDLVCAQGRYYITKNGTIKDAAVDKRLAGILPLGIAGLGEPERFEWPASVWGDIATRARQQACFYNTAYPFPVQRLAVMLHLMSPMMVFTADQSWGEDGSLPPTGFTVSLYSSKSGIGKSTVQKAAVEAFGRVGMVAGGGTHDMTLNAQVARAAMLGTYPYALDEVTDSSPERVATIINTVAGGMEKARSTVNGTQSRKTLTWSLVSSMSTNKPQRELLTQHQKSSDALQMRLLELNFDELDRLPLEALQRYDALREKHLSSNYGCLGALMSLYCVRRGWDEMRSAGQAYVSHYMSVLRGAQEGRFFVRALAAMRLAHDALVSLGCSVFEWDELEATFIMAYEQGLKYREANTTTGPGMVFRMLNELSPNIIVTAGDSLGAREDKTYSMHVANPIKGRRSMAQGYTIVPTRHVAAWCSEVGYSAHILMQDAVAAGLVDTNPDGTVRVEVVNPVRGVVGVAQVNERCVFFLDRKMNAQFGENVLTFPERGFTEPRVSQQSERHAP